MQIVINGLLGSSNSDSLIVLPPGQVDLRRVLGPVSKARREDLQLQSFIHALCHFTDLNESIEVLRGGDPPDRLVRVSDETVAVELTELTVQVVRRDFALIRQLARNLESTLAKKASNYPHLFGRTVVLNFLPTEKLPKNTSQIIQSIAAVLREDRGYVGEDLEGLETFPDRYPATHRGFYRSVGPVSIKTVIGQPLQGIQVMGSAQAQFLQSELLKVLKDLIEKKDIEGNDVLLMSCGTPDENGYCCPVDEFLYQEVLNTLRGSFIETKHVKNIIMHLWGTDQMVEIYRVKDYPYLWPPSRSTHV